MFGTGKYRARLAGAFAAVLCAAGAAQAREVVPFADGLGAGTIVVRTNERRLYLVNGDGTAIRYPVAVGKPGKQWSGATQIDALRAAYAAAGVQATLTPFIDDTAQAFADADLVICRAGASTVTELAAVAAAALHHDFFSHKKRCRSRFSKMRCREDCEL